MLTNVVPDVSMSKNLIEVRNLVKHFEVSNSFFSSKKNIVKAVDGISFNIKPGESLGCLLYTSPSPRDFVRSRMPSSA